MISRRWSGTAAAILCCLVLAALMSLFHGFVLDDAYITYRYAEHLAEHGTLAWNPGEHPVEGYTSLLWVLLNAAGLKLSLDPVVVSKTAGALAALAIAWILASPLGRRSWVLAVIVAGGVAFSPSFALLSMQGMETAVAALLLLLAARLASRQMDESPQSGPASLFAAVFAAFLARPDTAVFSAVLLSGVAAAHLAGRPRARLAVFLRHGAVLAGAIAVYMAWRLREFGWFFPNTYYVKMHAVAASPGHGGGAYALGFLEDVAAPYVLLLAAALVSRESRRAFLRCAPALAGTAAFFIYLSRIVPIQGMAWRFAYPVFPAFLMALGEVAVAAVPAPGRRPAARAAGAALLLVFFALWPLRDLSAARRIAQEKTQRDRVAAGKALAGLDGAMLTSEAGALPYYSGWKAVDLLGLCSEEIAHHGLSDALMEKLDPDLVLARYDVRDGLRLRPATASALMDFMARRDYEIVAVVAKNERDRHVYFARRGSPLFSEIAARLRGLRGVAYAGLNPGLVDTRIRFAPRGQGESHAAPVTP